MMTDPNLGEIRDGENALDQSLALNKVTMSLLHDRALECKRLWIALIISILVNVFTVSAFLWYESQWECTTTETTTVTQDTGEGTGNNVYQAGENATYHQGASETETGGE